MQKIIFLICLLTLQTQIQAQEPVILANTEAHYQKLGLQKNNIQAWEDGMRTDGGKNSYEWWYFDAILTDSTKLVFSFYTKHIENVRTGLKPFVLLSVVKKNGEHFNKTYSLDTTDYHFSKEKCDVKIGKSTIKGDLHHYDIHLDLPDIKADLTLDGEVPPWRPETGYVYFGKKEKEYFAWLPAVPKGKLSGTQTYQNETKNIQGSGYHDHNWGNITMFKLMNHWYWSRIDMGSYTLITSQIVAQKRYGYQTIPVFMIAQNGQILADNATQYMKFEPTQRTIEPFSKRPLYENLIFSYNDPAQTYILTLQQEHIIEKGQFIDVLKTWQRKIALLMHINPTYLRMTGAATLSINRQGKTENLKGHAIWEQFYFGENID